MEKTYNIRGIAFFIIALIISLTSFELRSQPDSSFTRHGNPFALIFTDMNYSFNKAGNSKTFELTRGYLGYEYFFSKTITSRINVDFGNPGVGELQMTAYVKNAFVQFKNEKLSGRIGVIGTDQFSLLEKQWGYRYIYMSFQDAYKFGPSADLGAGVEYSPAKIISFDLSVLNGEGYKKIQIDSTFKTTFGVTIKPFKGFMLRGYYDIMKNNYAQTTTSVFAGYSIRKFKAGLEYNIQKNNGMINGHDFSGISVYSSLVLADKFSVFARYDYLESVIPANATEPWNKGKDGQFFIAGFDYTPVKGVKIAPTYMGYAPNDKSKYFTSRIGLYFEMRF
jgi:hypothetical protein